VAEEPSIECTADKSATRSAEIVACCPRNHERHSQAAAQDLPEFDGLRGVIFVALNGARLFTPATRGPAVVGSVSHRKWPTAASGWTRKLSPRSAVTTTMKRHESEERRNEHAIRSLADRAGVALAEVRTRFGREFARLETGASIRSYLTLLTASNVLAALRREREPSSCAAGGAHAEMVGARRPTQMRNGSNRDRLIFESGSTWFCPCPEFAAANECGHTIEAAADRRRAGTDTDHGGTR